MRNQEACSLSHSLIQSYSANHIIQTDYTNTICCGRLSSSLVVCECVCACLHRMQRAAADGGVALELQNKSLNDVLSV